MLFFTLNESFNSGAMDFCQKRVFNFLNLKGNIFYCSSFNFEKIIDMKNNSKIFLTYYRKNSDSQNQLFRRLISMFLNYPDERINNFFADDSNQKNFNNFLMNLNFENFRISKFDGLLPGNSFFM